MSDAHANAITDSIIKKMTYLQSNKIYHGDSTCLINKVQDESVHLILSDIPYGIGTDDWDVIHENSNSAYLGASPAQKAAGSVFKKRGKPINGWSEADRAIPEQYQRWCSKWAPEWFRVVKPGGSVIIFAGRRLAHRCAIAMEDAGFNFKDSLAWIKKQAPHRAQRLSKIYDRRGDTCSAEAWKGWRVGNLRPTYEPILWFIKPYKLGGTVADNVAIHNVGAYNEKAFSGYVEKSENIIRSGLKSNEGGLHPTQKPIHLMQALIELTTCSDQLVLDPFAGSGSSLVAAKQLGRQYLGFEADFEFYEICKQRLSFNTIF